METKAKPYGYELILDLHGCDVGKFNRESLDGYFEKLCKAIDMKRAELHFWDYEGVPVEERPKEAHLLGTSAVQFIETSSIIIHSLDLLEAVYVNIFSCKEFDAKIAEKITREWFGANGCKAQFIERI